MAYLIVVAASLFYMARATAFRFDFRLRGGITRHQVGYSASGYAASIFMMAPRTLLPLIALHSLGNASTGLLLLSDVPDGHYHLLVGPSEPAKRCFLKGSFDDSQLPSLFRQSVILSIALIIPSVLVLWLAGPDLLLVFGHDFVEHGSQLVSVLALGPYAGDREHLGGLPAEADWSNAEPHLGEFRVRRLLFAGTG